METLEKYRVQGGATIIGYQANSTQSIYYRAGQFFDHQTGVIDWEKIRAVPQHFVTELQRAFFAQIDKTVRVNDAIAAAKKKIVDTFDDEGIRKESLSLLNEKLFHGMHNPNLVEEIEKETEEVIERQTAILKQRIEHRRQLEEMEARMNFGGNSESDSASQTNDGTQQSAGHNRKQKPPPVFSPALKEMFGGLEFKRSENDVYYARIAATQEDQKMCAEALCSLLRFGGQDENLPTPQDLFTAPLFNLGSPAKAERYIELSQDLVGAILDCHDDVSSRLYTDAGSGFLNKEKITEALNTLKNLGKVQAAYSQVQR